VSTRSRTVVALALLVGLVVALSGCGSKRVAVTTAEYVALGDSYTSGPGMEPVADKPCRRSSINYPSLVDKALKIKSFADRSCAGAWTGNLEQPQTVGYVPINKPQVDALAKSTRLVTIGMGLNDQELATGLLLTCLTPNASEPRPRCRQYLDVPQSTIDAQIARAAADVKAAIQTVRKAAPAAKIVLVGYPRVAPDQGSCPDLLPVPDAQLARMRASFQAVNEAWRAVAAQTGSLYVDMYAPSEGHDICSDDPWVSGYQGSAGKAAPLHPYPAYAKAVAAEILRVVGQ
jgi:hypothetical protein